MTQIIDPFTFAGGGTAYASQINARLAAIIAVVNGELGEDNIQHGSLGRDLIAPGVWMAGSVVGTNPGIGSGFTVTRPSTGTYVVTYAAAMAANPAVQITPVYAGASIAAPRLTASATTGFTVAFNDLGGAPLNSDFHFLAIVP